MQLRAAFKAIENNKQVALIAPTTVLAEQHYKRFCQRFSGYPITIENLSRLTQGKSKEILKNLKKGTTDMVIGTHRLLSDDVEFNNIGLLIIDEEQKFGVKAKETLKKKRQEAGCSDTYSNSYSKNVKSCITWNKGNFNNRHTTC